MTPTSRPRRAGAAGRRIAALARHMVRGRTPAIPGPLPPPPDRRPAATVVAYEDGPLLLRGRFEIATPGGETVPHRSTTVALCRCGHSSHKPLCDGTHRAVGFRAPATAVAPAPDPSPDPGGRPG